MTNKLISLVIIIFILSMGLSYSNEQLLFPKEKPSIFKKTEKQIKETISKNLPAPKPKLENKEPKKIEKIDKIVKKNEKLILSLIHI